MAKLSNPLEKWASRPLDPGQGLHLDLFRASIIMLEMGYEDEVIFEFVRRAAAVVPDRVVPDREIHAAISSAKARLRGDISTQTWPKFEPAYRAEVIRQYKISLQELAEGGETLSEDPWFYLTQIYSLDDWICLGLNSYEFGTQRLGDWQEPLKFYSYEYISPNPMRCQWGFTKENEPSMHSSDNCGPKIFQIVEFDFGEAVEHAAILRWLSTKFPLLLIVFSGGKSLHGWFDVRGRPEEQVLAFFQDAVTLGADPKMWSPVQFSRLPAGVNSRSKRHQSVVLFNPPTL